MKPLTKQQLKRIQRAYALSIGGEVAIVNLFEMMEEDLKRQIEELKQQAIDELESIREEMETLPEKAAAQVVIPVQDKIIEKTEVIREKPIVMENLFDPSSVWEKIALLEEEVKKPRGILGTIGGRAGFQVLSSGRKVGTKTNEINFVGATVADSYGRITVTTNGDITPTSVTTPSIIGGTAAGSKITYKSTTGTGTTTGIAHQFIGGTNGATIAATILNNGNVGMGLINPTFILQTFSGSSVNPVRFEKQTTSTNSAATGLELLTTSTGVMADGFGPLLLFSVKDTDGTTNQIASVTGIRDVADFSGALVFTTYNSIGNPVERMRIDSLGDVGIGVTAPTAYLHLKAGTATASTAPLKLNSGTLNTTAEPGSIEYNGNHYKTNAVSVRYPVGGTIKDFYFDGIVGGAETDIFTFTTIANTFNANGDKIFASYGGNFVTVGTELTQLRAYFAGTAIWDSTALAPATGTTSWRVAIELIRRSATVVNFTVSLNTSGATGYVYATSGELTGLTLSGTNILKITGTSSGVGNGVGDIVGKMGSISFAPAA